MIELADVTAALERYTRPTDVITLYLSAGLAGTEVVAADWLLRRYIGLV